MKPKDPRLSIQTLRVLRVFLETDRDFAGADLTRETKIRSGTLYPILVRLESAKWLKGRWEKIDPSAAGRPKKKFYRITVLGKKKTTKAIAELTGGDNGNG